MKKLLFLVVFSWAMFAQITPLTSVALPRQYGTFDIKANWSRNELYVAHSGSVVIIDTTTPLPWSVKKDVPLPSLQMVDHLCVSPTSGVIAVTTASSLVGILDPEDGGSFRVIDSGIFATDACAFSVDGKRLYVSSSLREAPWQKKLSAVDTSTWSVVQTWTTDEKNVPKLQTLPNGKVYALGQYLPDMKGDLKIIGTDGNIKTVDLGLLPQAIVVASNGRVYVEGIGGAVVIDADSDQIIERWKDGWGFGSPYFTFPSEDPWFCYSNNVYGNNIPTTLEALNIAQKKVVMSSTFNQNQGQTHGLVAHRQDDGSDIIVLLRDGRLDVFKAVQPPTLYAAVNGANYAPGPIAPGEIVTLFGAKLGTETAAATGTPLPTQLGGVQVLVNGQASPLYYVSPGQVNFQVPFDLDLSRKATVVVVTPQGNTNTVYVDVAATAPGQWPFVIHPDPAGWRIDSHAMTGETVILYASGLGTVSPPVPTGTAAPLTTLSRVSGMVEVSLAGQPCQVLFAGLAPGFVGLYQLNVEIPASAPAGKQNLKIKMGANSSSSFTLTVLASTGGAQ